MSRSAPWPRLLAAWWGQLGLAHVPVGPRVSPTVGVLPPWGPCPGLEQGRSCPCSILAQGCPCRASTASATKQRARDQRHKDPGSELCTVPGACHTWHPVGSPGGCATSCSATAVGAPGQPVGVRVGRFHGWGGRWLCRGCQAGAGAACCRLQGDGAAHRHGLSSICVLAAERGTVMRLFLTGWGGWRGLVPPWLYH